MQVAADACFSVWHWRDRYDELMKGATEHKNLEVTNDFLFLFGNGDGGGGPTPPMLEVCLIFALSKEVELELTRWRFLLPRLLL